MCADCDGGLTSDTWWARIPRTSLWAFMERAAILPRESTHGPPSARTALRTSAPPSGRPDVSASPTPADFSRLVTASLRPIRTDVATKFDRPPLHSAAHCHARPSLLKKAHLNPDMQGFSRTLPHDEVAHEAAAGRALEACAGPADDHPLKRGRGRRRRRSHRSTGKRRQQERREDERAQENPHNLCGEAAT